MTILRNDGTYVHVHTLDVSVHMAIKDAIRYRPDNYAHQYKYKYGKWDGYEDLYDMSTGTFRTGLLPRVEKVLNNKGIAYHVEVDPHKEDQLITIKHKSLPFTPHQYQDVAAASVVNNERGIIVLPTGSGKTFVISRIIGLLSRRTMIIVTDTVLLDQMHQEMSKFLDLEVGIIGDSEFEIGDVTVTTIQSLRSILNTKAANGLEKKQKLTEFIETVGVVVSDEAHLADSESFDLVLRNFKNTRRFYGLSATPYGWADKAEKKGNVVLEQHFGTKIYDGRSMDFIKIGIRVPLVVDYHTLDHVNDEYTSHFKRGPGGKKSPDLGKNYRECLETEILFNDEYAHKVAELAWNEVAAGRSVFVHAAHSIEFGNKVTGLIPGSVFVSGATTRKARRTIYDELRRKERLVMVSDVGGCIVGRANVFTSTDGMLSIKSLYDKYNNSNGHVYDNVNDSDVVNVTHLDMYTASYNTETMEPVLAKVRSIHRYNNKPDRTVVSTNKGTKLETSRTHPYLVENNGHIKNVMAQDLRVGDVLLYNQNDLLSNWPHNHKQPNTDIAWLLGMFAGDGNIGRVNFRQKHPAYKNGKKWSSIRTRIFNTDETIINRAKDIMEREIGIKCRIECESRYKLLALVNCSVKCGEWFLSKMEMAKPGAKTSTVDIPEWIKSSHADNIYAFLAGLIDSDGYVSKTINHVSISTNSKYMANSVSTIIDMMGIWSRTRYDSRNYEVSVVGHDNCAKLYGHIGRYLTSKHKYDRLSAIANKRARQPTNLARIKVREVSNIINNDDYLYDLSCETHNNYAAGEYGLMMIHNTGLDIKSLDTIILASDLKEIRQIAGRVLRADGTKKYGKVVDIAKHCMFLDKHARIRKNQYSNQQKHTPEEDDERED